VAIEVLCKTNLDKIKKSLKIEVSLPPHLAGFDFSQTQSAFRWQRREGEREQLERVESSERSWRGDFSLVQFRDLNNFLIKLLLQLPVQRRAISYAGNGTSSSPASRSSEMNLGIAITQSSSRASDLIANRRGAQMNYQDDECGQGWGWS
jgi:hypothetical protein